MDMKEQLSKLSSSFRDFWAAQERKRKIAYIAILVAIVLLAVILVLIFNKKDYVVLFEGLESNEASEIVTAIQDLGYEVTLRSGGTVIVPEGTENVLAMEMAMQGYPKSNLDYAFYRENIDMFTTSSQEREYARMATEERLGAIVGTLEGIQRATVTISIPEQKNTVISSLRQDATAFVVCYLNQDYKLTDKQIIGIRSLMRTGCGGLGLKDENISIVDGFGIPQIEGDEEKQIDVVADEMRKFAFKTNMENSIKEKVLELLLPIYGDEGVSAAVNMVLNFDKKVSENTDYSADGNGNTGVLQHGDAENASGGTTVEGGVVGVETNADDTYPTRDTNGAGLWSEEKISNTYLVDTYKEQIEKAGYVIDGLSIGVVVYTDYVSEAQKADLVNLVANAGGVAPAVAQDVVTVTNFPKFGSDIPVETVPTVIFGLTVNQLIVAAAILLILLIIIIVVLVITSRSAKNKRAEFEKQILESEAFAGLMDDGQLIDTFTMSMDGASPTEIPSLQDDGEETKEVAIRREITDFAKNSPEIVAQLLKNWMRDETEE